MKNLLLNSLIVFCLMLSCSKDDDSKTYTQDQLNGTWQNIVDNGDGCNKQLIIAPGSLKEATVCSNSGVTSKTTVTYDSYKFDGKKIIVQIIGVSATYTINELTATKLVLTTSAMGSSEKNEYKKIQ